MSNEKFTPGPWEALTDFETFDIGTHNYMPETGGHPMICNVNGYKGFTYEQRKANARLIAAAPEMYEVLKDILFIFRPMTLRADELVEKAKSLLNKINP